jgi:hypothetical protein
VNSTRGKGVLVVVAALSAALLGFMLTGHPVLLRLVDPSELTQFPLILVMNPFRDKAPERAAEGVLRDLRDRNLARAFGTLGKVADGHIREKETQYAIDRWVLIDRKDDRPIVSLFYKVVRKTSPTAPTIVVIRLERQSGGWVMSDFWTAY